MTDHESGEGLESIETWEQACIISQQWADGARLAAVKRKQRQRFWALMAVLLLIAAIASGILVITGNV